MKGCQHTGDIISVSSCWLSLGSQHAAQTALCESWPNSLPTLAWNLWILELNPPLHMYSDALDGIQHRVCSHPTNVIWSVLCEQLLKSHLDSRIDTTLTPSQAPAFPQQGFLMELTGIPMPTDQSPFIPHRRRSWMRSWHGFISVQHCPWSRFWTSSAH